MQTDLYDLHCRGVTVYVAVRPNIARSREKSKSNA